MRSNRDKTKLHTAAWNSAVTTEYVLTQGYSKNITEDTNALCIARDLYDADTIVVSGFPGIGKTYVFEHNTTGMNILDSDSSKFDKAFFPANYIEHIKSNIGKVDIIFVSSHDVVRDALVAEGISFVLIHPDVSIKDEYIQRYIQRGSMSTFVELLDKNWDTWVGQLDKQTGCMRIPLQSGQYLSDFIFK